MAFRCDICNKSADFGNNVSHSKVATKRQRKPNLQSIRLDTRKGRIKVRICSKCRRTMVKTH